MNLRTKSEAHEETQKNKTQKYFNIVNFLAVILPHSCNL
jgi:hypothetical protein